mgnify:CR=1 FL=1|jgi:hypothetical protein|tara:strand:+ start:93 stop:284 length:192 start_codon:yes stop_codon:yes gene_type:complete
MNDETIDEVVKDLVGNIPNNSEFPEELLRDLVIVAFEKQFDSNRDVLISEVKSILSKYGYSLS